jgi:hypothetical protein
MVEGGKKTPVDHAHAGQVVELRTSSVVQGHDYRRGTDPRCRDDAASEPGDTRHFTGMNVKADFERHSTEGNYG